MRLVKLDGVAAQPWRNGGGSTRELLAWPSADWRVRVSVADIDREGPFSPFPGVERWFAVLQGHGVRLRLDGAWATLRAGEPPLRFDGAAAPDCRLLDGPTRDLNLMLRGVAGRLSAAPQVARHRAAGLFTLRPGRIGTAAVPAHCLAWFDGAAEPFAPDDPADATPAAWWIQLEEQPA